MEHEQVKSLLSEYLEQNLQTDVQQQIEEHLSVCPECKNEFELLRQALTLVQQLPRVEAPADFPARIKRRARKAGLFDSRRRRSDQRYMVPFEPAMVIVLATVGALIFTLLLFQNQLQTLFVEKEPTVVMVDSIPQINKLASATWDNAGRVRALGREVPARTRLGAPWELDLCVPEERWTEFRTAVGEVLDQFDLPVEPPAADAHKMVCVIVQVRLKRSAGPLPDPKGPP
ncbi:MAG: zf-HC2 domain-containing protein [Deltaproteobacteria bacterium]|nr:zf-HC2 domain-containing protein [Deltaproteobacteria bacterium]MBW1872787.1 zf-HC2 domain-containing protein [Deltaproteobacteria bacterium]